MQALAEINSNTLVLDQAKEYMKLGFHVIPLTLKTDKPVIRLADFKGKELNQDNLTTWFFKLNYNIGFLTGKDGGNFYCLQIDKETDFNDFIQANPEFVKNAPISKGAQARHIWFRSDLEIASCDVKLNNTHIGRILGDGEYVIAPPSLQKGILLITWEQLPEGEISKITSLSEIGLTIKKKRNKKPPRIITTDRASFKEFISYKLGKCETKIAEAKDKKATLYNVACECFCYTPHYVDYDDIYYPLMEMTLQWGASQDTTDEILQKAYKHAVKSPRTLPDGFKDKNKEQITDLLSSIKIFPRDDIGNKERFVYYFGHDFLTTIDKQVYHFNGTYWDSPKGESILMNQLCDLSEIIKKEARLIENEEERNRYYFWARESASRKTREYNMKDIKDALLIDYNEIDNDDSIINLKNGILDIETGEILPHSREARCSKIMNVSYEPEVKCPKWMQFIGSIFGGNQELIHYIQKMCGYFLTGSTKEQCVFFFYGNGSNGKSTFINALEHIMADYKEKISIESLMIRNPNGSAPSPDIAKLKGARLVIASEANAGHKFNEALLKDMRGGDSITARHLHKAPITFTPKYKLLMYGNHQPRVIGTDHGIRRTIKMIPFTQTFTDSQKDPDLMEKLKTEKSGIFNWIIDGLKMWNEEGLGDAPKAIKDETDEYFARNDGLGEFLDEYTEETSVLTEMPSPTLFWYTYDFYQKEFGEYSISSRELKKRMEEKGFKQKKGSTRCWDGIKLTDSSIKRKAIKRQQEES